MFNSSARILKKKNKYVFKIYNMQFENCKFKLLFSVNLVYLQAVNILNATFSIRGKTVLPCAMHEVTPKSRFINSDEFRSLVYTFTLFTVTMQQQ